MRTFLLSEAQKFFLRELRQLHCVTEAQAWHLLVESFGLSENAVAPIQRQLKTAALVRRLDGVIVLDGSKPDPQRLMANELLLGLYPANLPRIREAPAPFLLTAVTEDRQLPVASLPIGAEVSVCCAIANHSAEAGSLPTVYALLLEAEQQISALKLSRPCLLAYYSGEKLCVVKHKPNVT